MLGKIEGRRMEQLRMRWLDGITNSRSSPKLMSIKSVMPSSHLILCHPLLLLPPIPPSIRVFSNESVLCIRWPKYWSFSISSIQFSSVAQSCLTLCDPMDCSTPGFPALLHLPGFTQTHQLVMPSNHLILCRPLLLPPSIFPSIGVFSN